MNNVNPAAANGDEEEVLHILLVPVPSEGHINGLLRLAQALAAEKGVLVTFAYPARFHSLALKRNKLPCLLNPSSAQSNPMLAIKVVDDGLPLEETDPMSLEQLTQASFASYRNSIELLLDDLLLIKAKPSLSSSPSDASCLPPLRCIISDTFAPWMQDLADAVGLPRIDFWASTAAVYSMGTQLSALLSSGILPLPKSCWFDDRKWTVDAQLIEGIPGLPPFPPTELPVEFVHPEEVSDRKLQLMVDSFTHVRKSHTILVHSIHELESQVFDALRASCGYPIYAVGPLLDSATPSLLEPSTEGDRHECMQWLDKQPDSSVIYVAVGSITKLELAEMHAVALGLEASGHRFLWVVRRDSIAAGITLSESLPEGFLQRTVDKGSGLIISWSLQAEVLGHPAVAAFFSHCGWNSTLESMSHGVPMVACPLAAEQRSNARWIVEKWKIGVELERQKDGRFTKEAVERALQEVLALEGKGGPSEYKKRVLHVKEVARSSMQEGGHSHTNLINLLQRLRHPTR